MTQNYPNNRYMDNKYWNIFKNFHDDNRLNKTEGALHLFKVSENSPNPD